MYPNEKSGLERKLLHCTKCNKPMAEIIGNDIYTLLYENRKPRHVRIEIKHDAGGRVKINCEDCGREHFFATATKTLGMTYAVAKKKKNVDKSN